MLKKSVAAILSFILVFGVIATSAGAFFGSGAAVVASQVKMIKSGLAGHKITFSDADFKSALCISDFDTLTITEIPTSLEGTLLIGGRRVSAGKEIKRKNIGGMVFVPASKSVTECSFKFKIDGGSEVECLLKFADKVNYAPEADPISTVKTQMDISVYEKANATDPESDELEFIIVSYPKNGRICFLEEGRFCYTPNKGYLGEDEFSYTVRDSFGNYSKPTSVKLEVIARMCAEEYIDMEDRAEYNAAVAMAAMGIMGGEIVGDDTYFMPDRELCRAEFVALAMKALGIRADSSISASYFDDDGDIQPSLKPYVATAQRLGIISGDFIDGKLVFEPNRTITKFEAAKILSSLIGAERETEESVFATEDDIPVWAKPCVYAMCSLGIFEENDAKYSSAAVTKASAAEYLYRAIKLS